MPTLKHVLQHLDFYWGQKGISQAVGFLDTPKFDLALNLTRPLILLPAVLEKILPVFVSL
jgi:hypothetical protein